MPRSFRMNPKFAFLAGVAVLTATASVPAHAALLNFDLTGSRNATFQLDSNPTPTTSSTSVFGDQIQFSNVSGTFNGMAGTASAIGFGTGPIFASLNILSTALGFTQFAGPTLFSGTATAPIFSTGTFALTSIVSGSSTLTISQAMPAAVPEPATWAIMIAGLGMIGYAVRRRSVKFASTAT